jgi:hypothetical protein
MTSRSLIHPTTRSEYNEAVTCLSKLTIGRALALRMNLEMWQSSQAPIAFGFFGRLPPTQRASASYLARVRLRACTHR